MPLYQFKCREDIGGCGNEISITCLMSELDSKKPKSCDKCKKRTTLSQTIFPPKVNIPVTLGSLADKNTARTSNDERQYIHAEHNKYKTQEKSWIPTPDGMVHKDSIK